MSVGRLLERMQGAQIGSRSLGWGVSAPCRGMEVFVVRRKPIELAVLLVVAALALVDGVAIASGHQLRAAEAGGYEILLGSLLLVATAVYWIQEPETGWGEGHGTRWVLTAIAILAAYAFLMSTLGYLLSTLLAFIVYLRVFSSYRWVPILAYSAVVSVGSAWLWISLAIALPEGVLPWP